MSGIQRFFPSRKTSELLQYQYFGVGAGATGGIVSTGGGYKIHSFTSVGISNFNVIGKILNVEYLIVAGGGGNGGGASGIAYPEGGGGGQLITSTLNVENSNYQLTVGGGGLNSENGQDSIFNNITANKGLTKTVNGRGGTSGSGNVGGNLNGTAAGGGGGNSAVGGNAPSSTQGGNGGAGTSSSISGSSVGYGGGGGGGAFTTGGTGTNGGGNGSGTNNLGGTNGTPNTGGGSGGAPGNFGGSGIIIIRYLV